MPRKYTASSDDEDIFGAMSDDQASSPSPSPRRGQTRKRTPEDDGSDSAPAALRSQPSSVDGNTMGYLENFAKHMELEQAQRKQLRTFISDTPLVREGKLFAVILKLQSLEKHIHMEAERFEISDSCRKNIRDLAIATLLSTRISSYSEEHPKILTMKGIQRQQGWDLPAGWDLNRANWDTVRKLVEVSLNNKRSDIKKLLIKSVYGDKQRKPGQKRLPLLNNKVFDSIV